MNPNQKAEASPQVYARIGGVIYLIIIVAGIFGELFVRGKLIVPGNPAATANNIMAHEQLWRMGIAGDLLMHLCDVPLMLVFYILLRPVNKNLALLAVLFNLVQTAVLAANKLNLLTTLFLSDGTGNLKTLEPHQLNALAYVYTRVHGYGFSVGLMFFGCTCLVLGYLIFRSGYLPKILGVLMQIAGLCYLTNSFILIIAPSIENIVFPAILVPPFIAELSLCLWLLIKGVNLTKWNMA
ncbi:DUF4386 domain-containing protein [Mucilaginibacter sp.]|uniref:DUF4386 domain-containing protein n=1 Tax=Mucilaginibacter sp. TaxID=1882438 RepID=UPI003562E2AC